MPLSFTLSTAVPFTVDVTSLSLQPGEGASLMISFDPDYRWVAEGD